MKENTVDAFPSISAIPPPLPSSSSAEAQHWIILQSSITNVLPVMSEQAIPPPVPGIVETSHATNELSWICTEQVRSEGAISSPPPSPSEVAPPSKEHRIIMSVSTPEMDVNLDDEASVAVMHTLSRVHVSHLTRSITLSLTMVVMGLISILLLITDRPFTGSPLRTDRNR